VNLVPGQGGRDARAGGVASEVPRDEDLSVAESYREILTPDRGIVVPRAYAVKGRRPASFIGKYQREILAPERAFLGLLERTLLAH
jgi:hypothetical protein